MHPRLFALAGSVSTLKSAFRNSEPNVLKLGNEPLRDFSSFDISSKECSKENKSKSTAVSNVEIYVVHVILFVY